jgi:predicted transposase YbfD/YdcC
VLALKGNQATLSEDIELYFQDAMKTQRVIGESQSEETLFYISSLAPQAKMIGEVIRSHWGIDNSLHWVLDIAFREDEYRKRKDHSAENFAMLRRITLNLLKQEKTCKRSIAGKRLLAGWYERYLEKVLFQA